MQSAVDAAGVAVILPHPHGCVAADGVLRVKAQQVVVAPEVFMQAGADVEDEGAGLIQRLEFERLQGVQPVNHMEIAQAAGMLFDVGLQMVDGVGELGVAGAGHASQVLDDGGAFGRYELREQPFQSRVTGGVAGKETPVQQADGQLQVAVVDLAALRGGVHGLADAKPGIPKNAQKRRNRLALGSRGQGVHQQQKIDVGIGKQLLPAIAADGQKRDGGRGLMEGG